MTLDFPTSPSLNDTYSFGGKTWIWVGEYWRLNSAGAINDIPIGNITANTGNFTTLSVATGVSSNLVPTANVTFDLGADTLRWRDIYLANSTIYLGEAQISANTTSLILTNPQGGQTVFSGATADIAADTVTATSNVSGGNVIAQSQGGVLFNDSDNSHFVGFRANAVVAADVVWTLPVADGNSGQVLSTNGSGVLTFVTGGGGGGGGITWTTQANTAPVIANPGDFWYDSASQIKYQYYDDGTGDFWVDQSAPTTFASISTGQIINASGNGVGNIGSAGTLFGNIFVGTTNSSNIISDTVSLNSIIKSGSNGVGNIGSASNTFDTVFAKATSAQYADLAEIYRADHCYEPGTVVIFGGTCEVTQSEQSHDVRIAGVVSTDPAFIMNSGQTGDYVVPVALTGRVPCRVIGPVSKGDILVSSDQSGAAQRMQQWRPGCVIGKSLIDSAAEGLRTIEISVGRF